MANEIWTDYSSGFTLYAVVRKASDDTVNIIGGNTFETWVDGNIATYVLALTDHGGDYYSVDFPSGITDTTQQPYRVAIYLQSGVSPAVADQPISQGEIFWDGVNEVNIGTINITNQTVTNVYDESTPPPVVVINV